MKEVMTQQYSETAQWSDWCLENMLTLLHHRFPHCNIWIIKPVKMLRNIYSCFHNFLQCSIVGTPESTEYYGAITHLHQLLLNGAKTAGIEVTSLPVVLVGFSKGCVVLNQIVHELDHVLHHHNHHSASNGAVVGDFDNRAFLKLVKEIYWLDSGHNGEDGAWITREKEIKALVSLGAELHIHVTPQQVSDPLRMWIGEEHTMFLEELKRLGATVYDTFHFKVQPRSLENHFKILNEF